MLWALSCWLARPKSRSMGVMQLSESPEGTL